MFRTDEPDAPAYVCQCGGRFFSPPPCNDCLTDQLLKSTQHLGRENLAPGMPVFVKKKHVPGEVATKVFSIPYRFQGRQVVDVYGETAVDVSRVRLAVSGFQNEAV